MAQYDLSLVFVILFVGLVAEAALVEHTFNVGSLTVRRLCKNKVITAVNGRLPGPTIEVSEGDRLVVHVINQSPYSITIHWHGVFQKLSGWYDGPNMITQCPIRPGSRFTYNFTVDGQEGTLWWHAHVSYLRATVYGALVIRPRGGRGSCYPFPKPHAEVPILLGEWWNANDVDVDKEAFLTGAGPNVSDAFTINGRPGHLYQCPKKHTYKLTVVAGKTYMLRIINAALNSQLFFKVAGHSFTVVGVDASYTKPYATDVIAIAPGQTVDALMAADAVPAKYYMASLPYISTDMTQGPPFDGTTATAVVQYRTSAAADALPSTATVAPMMPTMPALNDTPTAHKFYTNLTALRRPGTPTVPLEIDEHMFVAFGLGRVPCQPGQLLCNRTTGALAASMNNVSFQFPTTESLLQAHYAGANDVSTYTSDFPDKPPRAFDFTGAAVNYGVFTEKGTKVKRLRHNATVEVVLQNTGILGVESHPLHLHGFNFFVVAQGFGNYDEAAAAGSYNLVDPQVRNTVAVPVGGWAVIRFVADNPGVWIMHCHLDGHLPMGLAAVFEVENGRTPDSILPPPPPDFPGCEV